jgi:hypothetical protein
MTWDATFTDARGRFPATIASDGTRLTLSVRGATFFGRDFSELKPDPDMPEALSDGFSFSDGTLAACAMALTIPLPLVVDGQSAEGALGVEVRLKDPGPTSRPYEALILTLAFGDVRATASGADSPAGHISFEDQLLDLIGKLPPGISIRSCFTCQYADYSVYGNGSFGCMLCFRNHKAAYDRVRSKDDFLELHDHFDRPVQETWLCTDFTPRLTNAGYRGWPDPVA